MERFVLFADRAGCASEHKGTAHRAVATARKQAKYYRHLTCSKAGMRQIKLTGREATVVRAIGFTEAMAGAEILDYTRMEAEDVTDTLNSLMAAGFVESLPYYEQVDMAEMPGTTFEINPAYAHELKAVLLRP